MSKRTAIKDPNSVEPFFVVWCDPLGVNNGGGTDFGELQGATIATSAWTVVSGSVEIDSDSIAAIDIHGVSYPASTVAQVWLTGGTDGAISFVRNRITTSDGRTLDQTLEIPVKEL